MGPAKKLQISQEAFDAVVNDNVEEFGMERDEALEDAITTFKLQGVDLSGIITDGGGGAALLSHPVIKAIQELNIAIEALSVDTTPGAGNNESKLSTEQESIIMCALSKLQNNSKDGECNDSAIIERHGGVEALVNACKVLTAYKASSVELALAALSVNLNDDQSREKFRLCSGPQVVFESLSMEDSGDKVLQHGAAVVAAASQKNEDIKDIFVILKVHEVLLNQLKHHQACTGGVQGVCDALRSLVTADDERIAVSRAFQNGMLIAKTGAMTTLLEIAQQQIESTSVLPSLCIAIKNLAVNVRRTSQ